MIFAPLQGFRHVEVTDKRTSIDFAHICRDLVDVYFQEAQKILLVCDTLNTHKSASLYKAFPHDEALCIAEADVYLVHNIPIFEGGTNALDNLTLMCAEYYRGMYRKVDIFGASTLKSSQSGKVEHQS